MINTLDQYAKDKLGEGYTVVKSLDAKQYGLFRFDYEKENWDLVFESAQAEAVAVHIDMIKALGDLDE